MLLIPFVLCLLGQRLNDYKEYYNEHQNILVIGETGSGKSTFIQYMLVQDVAIIDDKLIFFKKDSLKFSNGKLEVPQTKILGF